MTTRRSFLTGLSGFIACSPAIVRASSLMPVKVLVPEEFLHTQMTVGYTVTVDRMRALLMPGLVGLMQAYENIPPQWPQVFKPPCPIPLKQIL